jgi:hypothetical protein
MGLSREPVMTQNKMKTPGGTNGRPIRNMSALGACALLVACSGDFESDSVGPQEGELGTVEQAIAACPGDDALYDYNAFAASLAAAIGKELGRWDVVTDFEVRDGKLELSPLGVQNCGTGCASITALLRLQDDVSSGVPYHSPSLYRSKLTTWYARQQTELTKLVDKMLVMDQGTYRLKNRGSGKYMNVAGGSTSDNAAIQSRSTASQYQSNHWRVVLDHGAHKLINVRSGKCLALSQDSAADNVPLVQLACSTSPLQRFSFSTSEDGYLALRTKTGQGVRVKDGSSAEDTPIVQFKFDRFFWSQEWMLELVAGIAISPVSPASAMYTIRVKNSGGHLGVDAGLMYDGALIEQREPTATDMRYHWYVTHVANSRYNLVNRKSGKCMDLASNVPLTRIVQRTCSTSPTQLFTFGSTGDGQHLIFSANGWPLEVEGYTSDWDVPLRESQDRYWPHNRLFALTPLLAAEPHRLTYSHKTDDGPCGDYYWYNIKQPNGLALRSPADSYVQLIFAGGKTTLAGTDENPFIAQQVSGSQVAIDPTYGLNDTSSTTTGTCAATCVKVSTTNVAGQCCSCSGSIKKFARSTWNANTYLCQ